MLPQGIDNPIDISIISNRLSVALEEYRLSLMGLFRACQSSADVSAFANSAAMDISNAQRFLLESFYATFETEKEVLVQYKFVSSHRL